MSAAIRLEPVDEGEAQVSIRRLRECIPKAATMAEELESVLARRTVTEEVLARHSKWCHTGGSWKSGVEPARAAARALYGFVPERMLDSASRPVPGYADMMASCRRRIEGRADAGRPAAAVRRQNPPIAAARPPAALVAPPPAGDSRHARRQGMGSTEEARWRASVPGYEILDEIGRGGFATVFRARQVSVNRVVALKLIPAGAPDETTRRRFRSECEAVGNLSWHPHVVSLYDAGTAPSGAAYLAMELLPGGSLGRRVAHEGPMPAHQVRVLGIHIADALAAAHEAGVLHRDVKPDNVLVGRRAEALLGDFGIAVLADATQSATNSFVGSLAYGAPELLRGAQASERSDVYSLGATLYTLLTARSPFGEPEATPASLMWQVATEPPPPLPATVPRDLALVVGKAMAKEPGDRPPTARTIEDMLRGVGSPASPAPGQRGSDADTVAFTKTGVLPSMPEAPSASQTSDEPEVPDRDAADGHRSAVHEISDRRSLNERLRSRWRRR